MSVSLASSVAGAIVSAVSSLVVVVLFTATGASLTAATFSVTVAVEVAPLPSEMVYVKLASPSKLAVGVNSTSLPTMDTVPFTAPCTLAIATTSAGSTSSSLPSSEAAVMDSGVSSVAASTSARASGASFTPPTLTVTVFVAKPPLPSLTVYWKLPAPAKSAVGVNTMLPLDIATVPPVPFCSPVTDSVSRSTSVSFRTRLAGSITSGVSSTAVTTSATATGASFTAARFTVTMPVV